MQGMAPRALRGFVGRISEELDWDFILLQECGRCNFVKEVDGHRVICSSPRAGERCRVIVVHASLAAAVVEDCIKDVSRMLSVDLKLESYTFRLASCHMSANHDKKLY